MNIVATYVAREFIYLQIPASELRNSFDTLFSGFSKFPLADSVMGPNHRWMAGHDLGIDVPKTLFDKGIVDAYNHTGHIVLTDFPTRMGIPIPFFSHSGLGQLLVKHGIPSGWLNISLFDSCIGILAVAEGSSNLIKALNGTLIMNSSTFFTTYVKGSLEVVMATYTTNPLLLVGGIENLLAGVVATWKRIHIYVDPYKFWGAAFTGALLGFAITYLFQGERNIRECVPESLRSSVVNALFSVNTYFGFGALGGLLAFKAGELLAKEHNKNLQALLKIDRNSYESLLNEFTNGFSAFLNYWELSLLKLSFIEHPILSPKDILFKCEEPIIFPNETIKHNDESIVFLNVNKFFD
jgi:hypothetical protein